MKTFDIITAIMFTVTTLACFCAGFFNPIHFAWSAISLMLVALSIWEHKSENKKILKYLVY